MSQIKKNIQRAAARKNRVRKQVRGTQDRPRLHVFRSNKHVYAQVINDAAGVTLVSASEKELKDLSGTKADRASKIGELLANKAMKANITKVRFDRGPYRFHGRIKALLEAVREKKIEV